MEEVPPAWLLINLCSAALKSRNHFDPDLQTIVADEAQLKQVFLNIIMNAAQAMEKW